MGGAGDQYVPRLDGSRSSLTKVASLLCVPLIGDLSSQSGLKAGPSESSGRPAAPLVAALVALIAAVTGACAGGGAPSPPPSPRVAPTEVVDSGGWRDTRWRLLLSPNGSEGFCARFDWTRSDGSFVDGFADVCAPEPQIGLKTDAMYDVALRQPAGQDEGVIVAVIARALDTVTLTFSDGTSEVVHLNGPYLIRFFESKELVDLAGRGPDGSYANCRPRVVERVGVTLSCDGFGRRSRERP